MEKESLARLLGKDEMVLWSGKPAPYKILDKYYKPIFIRQCIITISTVALLFCLVLYFGMSGRTEVNYPAVAVLLCVPFIFLLTNLFFYLNYKRKSQYLVTNRNIIVYLSDTQKRLFPLSFIDRVESVQQGEDTWSIRIGKAGGIPQKKNLKYAMDFLTRDISDEANRSCLLYNLSGKDAKRVLELIERNRVIA
jgi:hypothetical protein